MKHKHFTLVIVSMLILFTGYAIGGNVEKNVAKNVALNSYKENYYNLYGADIGGIYITDEFTISEKSQPLYYIFNTSNGGFVIIAADDIFHPVIGYSFESIYSENNPSPEFTFWMEHYKQEIISDVSMKLSATPDISAEWNRYSVKPENFTRVKSGTKDVAPLMTSTWDQGCCYNTLCPYDATATNSCSHAYTGCVATSMAQVMYYWRYPATGQGSHSYTPWGSGYPVQSASFGTTTYNWNGMTDACSGTNNDIATLSYHCGVAVDMNYGPNGSSANTGDWTSSLPSYFKYSSNINEASKDMYSNSTWEGMVRTQLDAGQPVVYTGYDPSASGHAWVCDGYQGTSSFHMNWGWSGIYDGYFTLAALNAGGYDFSTGQSMVYNIYPPSSSYPSYCSGTGSTLTTDVGTLTDGSGPVADYNNNADCQWLIAPASIIDHLTIKFISLNTEAMNDSVTIYDGSTTSDPVLGTFSGTTLPTQFITTTGPTALVRFTTNGSATDAGWKISYSSSYPVYCTGTTTLTDASGSFEDGSGTYDYSNNANCKWDIKPTGASSVTLHFVTFSLETTNDKVRITDIVNGTLLGNFSGTTIPADVTSPSGQMKVLFTSNGSITDDGFSCTYTSVTGIEEYGTIKDLNIYPNPASDMLHISFGIVDDKDATVQLVDLEGRQVYGNAISNGTFTADLNLSSYAKGIYMLRIITTGETVNKKVVIE